MSDRKEFMDFMIKEGLMNDESLFDCTKCGESKCLEVKSGQSDICCYDRHESEKDSCIHCEREYKLNTMELYNAINDLIIRLEKENVNTSLVNLAKRVRSFVTDKVQPLDYGDE